MKRTIEPRPTIYDGERFRSQLEAKWAMFFNELRILWLYEPRTYALTAGTRYLPDFRLPGFCRGDGDFFVEVKPAGFPTAKAREFARQYRTQVLIAAGEPWSGPHEICIWDRHTQELLVTDSWFVDKYLPRGSHQNEYRMFVNSGVEDPTETTYSARKAALVAESYFSHRLLRSPRYHCDEVGEWIRSRSER